MHYFSSDHLGSTRLVTDPDGNVLEQFDYLPYGQKCNNSSLAVANQHKTDYLYTGKELPEAFFGIDWYDSVARFQTTSGVFTSPDPLAEKYYSVSPYAYCAGKPVNRIDPNGMDDRDKEGYNRGKEQRQSGAVKHKNRSVNKESGLPDVRVPKGYRKTNYVSHGKRVYTNGKNYISRDADSHNGGVWKKAKSVKELQNRNSRLGTYDENLKKIGR